MEQMYKLSNKALAVLFSVVLCIGVLICVQHKKGKKIEELAES